MDYFAHHQGGGGLPPLGVHVPPPPPPPSGRLFGGAAQAERPRSPPRGQPLYGRDSAPQEEKKYVKPDPSDNVYMVGLPQDSTEASVKSVFSEYGTVHSVKMLPIKAGTDCAAALVRMGNRGEAQNLVDNVHGEIPKGLDHVVTIRFANAKGQGKGKDKDEWGPTRSQMALNVSGCSSLDVSDIIRGKYQVSDVNHNKSVYRKEGEGSTVVLIYYWDDRDGPNFHGWWFGPKIGGDQVWAYNEDKRSPNPPGEGWRVPWNGSVDASLKVTTAPGSGAQALFHSMLNNPYADWAAGNSSSAPASSQKDEVIQQRVAALKEKRQQEETMRYEQAAALVVRKVIQKLRTATPDMFDEVRRELDTVQTENMENMGQQAEKVMQEAEKAIAQVQEKIDEQNMKKMAEEQKRLEEEVKKKEEAFRIENTTKEATDDVVQAEAQVEQATALGVPVTEKEAEEDLTVEGIFEAVQIVEEALVGAQATMDKASASLILKKAELGATEQAVDALKSEFKPLFTRLAECRRTSATLSKRIKVAKEKAAAKEKAEQERKAAEAAAAKKEEEQKAAFAKFDADGDGKLNKDEIVAFAKAEYDLTPTDDHVEKWISGFGAEGGVAYGNLARLRSVVGIARSEAKAREKRMEEEAKEKEISDIRAALCKRVTELHASVTEADGLVAKVVASAAALAIQGESEKLLEAIAETEASAREPGEEAARILLRVEELEGEDASEDAKGFLKKEMFKARSRISALHGKLEKVAADVAAAKQRADQLAEGRMEELRVETVVCIRDYMDAGKKTEQQLFEEVCAGVDDVPADKLASFASSLPSAPEFKDGEAIQLFQHVLETEGCSAIGKDVFHKLIRLFYQVVRATVITDALDIKGKVIRRLEVGEILERTHGTQQEETNGVKRMQCRSSKDGKTDSGWVTVSGNQGSAFLKPVSPLLEGAKQMASLLSDAGGA